MELSFLDIMRVLLKRVWIIILCTVIGFVGAFLVSSLFIAPTYTSTCLLYVNPGNADTGTQDNYVGNYNDLQYAQKLVNSYLIILRNDVFLNQVASVSTLPYSVKQIRNMLSLTSINNTEFFEVKINSANPEDSTALVQTISMLAPAEIIRIKESDSVKVVSPATHSSIPTAPNVMLISVIGAMLGFILAVGIAILIEVLDIRVKSEDDLISRYSLPILGSIPKYDEE
jgi:polysaccharide biosynthesis transport protein